MNKIVIMGRLTAAPELRTTPNGISVTRFTVAVQRDYAKPGEERATDFLDVVAWRDTAEFVTKYFTKGSMIAVAGSLQTNSYVDKNGVSRKGFEIVADNVYFTGSKRENGSYSQDNSYSSDNAPATYSGGSAGDFEAVPTDDDLPF